MPAVAVIQEDLVIFSGNRRKGCVGAPLEFVEMPGYDSGATFNLWGWNCKEVIGIAKPGPRSIEFSRNTVLAKASNYV